MPLVWSPPLYSRKEYITGIRIKEEGLENPKKNPEFREMLQQCRQEWEQATTDPLYICIQFKCTVRYYPVNYDKFEFFDYPNNGTGILALLLKKCIWIRDKFDRPDRLQEFEAVKDLINNILQDYNISWNLYLIHVLKQVKCNSYILEDEYGMTYKVMLALAAKATNWMEARDGIIPLGLHIFKHVSISVDEHDAWRTWFEEKLDSDPNFPDEYREKITRLRILDEILEEEREHQRLNLFSRIRRYSKFWFWSL